MTTIRSGGIGMIPSLDRIVSTRVRYQVLSRPLDHGFDVEFVLDGDVVECREDAGGDADLVLESGGDEGGTLDAVGEVVEFDVAEGAHGSFDVLGASLEVNGEIGPGRVFGEFEGAGEVAESGDFGHAEFEPCVEACG